MIFEITPEHIAKLTDTDLRTLVGKLAEQVLAKSGHSYASVTYGGHQNAADGGIDVRVSLPSDAEIVGYVPKPSTGFQVKAEDMPRSAILNEMKPDGVLRESIKELGRQEGAYIIVSSKGSVADSALSARKNAMGEAVAADPDAASVHVDFFDRQRLASWVNENPGLIPWVREKVGQPIQGWQPFTDWSSTPGATDAEYVIDDTLRLVGASKADSAGVNLKDGIERLRATLGKLGGAVRLVGLSGVGKTRLVQALFDDRLGAEALNPNLAVYTDIGDEPSPVPLELLSHLGSLSQRAILIVDNCGMDLHKKLVTRMRKSAPQVSIITVEFDIRDDEPEGTDVFRLEPSSADVLQKILRKNYPELTAAEASTIADFSEGNARIALALANTARNGESLADLKDSDLFERLFRQKHEVDPELLKAAKACALVYSFDGETLEGEEAELPLLAELAGQSVEDLHARVSELYRRQLVQKRARWRAILPHALANKLARQALEDIPIATLLNVFMKRAPARMMRSFSRRLGYLHDSEQAQRIVEAWLGENGFLSRIEELDEVGFAILANIAPIAPEKTLECIGSAFERAPELAEATHRNRRDLISLLRHLGYDAEHFEDALTLIAQCAAHDPDTNDSSNARPVFVSMFMLYLSGTHASAEQRAAFLERLAGSEDKVDQELARSGVESMLRCDSFSSGYDFSFGTRPRDYGFYPRARDDIRRWYQEAFGLCAKFGNSDAGSLNEIRAHVANQFGWIAENTALVDELIQLARSFMAHGEWAGGWAAVRSGVRRARKAGEEEAARKFEELAKELAPTNLSEKITNYVLPPRWSALDIADIEEDDEQKHREAQAFVDAVCAEVGTALAEDSATLIRELPRLVSGQASRTNVTGEALANSAENPKTLWEQIVQVYLQVDEGERNYGLLSGFISALGKTQPELAAKILDQELDKERLSGEIVHWQAIIGFEHGGFDRMMRMLEQDWLSAYPFRIMGHGGTHKALNSKQMAHYLRALAERSDGGVDCAIEVLQMRYFGYRSDKEPVPESEKPIGREILSKIEFGKSRDGAHDITEIARGCLTAPSDEPIAKGICRNLRAALSSYETHGWNYQKLVRFLASEFPEAVLDELVEHGKMGRGFRREMFATLRDEGACIFSEADMTKVLAWVNISPTIRAPKLAKAIGYFHQNKDEKTLEWTPLALALMGASPNPEAVLDIFFERFQPSSWSGSRADIMENRMSLLRALEKHSVLAIQGWAKKAIPELQKQIKATREWEEQHDRERDERFE